MSKGMYCSASHWIDSASSSGDMAGRVIFLMITEWQEREGAELEFLTVFSLFSREIVSTTREESMIEPSTMASGERRSIPILRSWYVPPFFSFSSTSFTADEPISRPTTFLLFEKNTAHPIHLTLTSRWRSRLS